jgi:hypothetical protein
MIILQAIIYIPFVRTVASSPSVVPDHSLLHGKVFRARVHGVSIYAQLDTFPFASVVVPLFIGDVIILSPNVLPRDFVVITTITPPPSLSSLFHMRQNLSSHPHPTLLRPSLPLILSLSLSHPLFYIPYEKLLPHHIIICGYSPPPRRKSKNIKIYLTTCFIMRRTTITNILLFSLSSPPVPQTK